MRRTRIGWGILPLWLALLLGACARPQTPLVAGALPDGLDTFLASHPLSPGHTTPMRAGDAAVIPRDRVHWFAQSGDEPAVTLAVFTPPLDAPDSVPESGVDTMEERR